MLNISIIAATTILINPLFILKTIFFPIISVFFIYDAFTRVNRMQKNMDEKLEPLNDRIEILKKMIENHPVIRQGIQEELAQIDLTNTNVDMKRVQQLVAALDQLEKSVALIEKLKT
jgi:endonuclease V-like protein UPF0215 family